MITLAGAIPELPNTFFVSEVSDGFFIVTFLEESKASVTEPEASFCGSCLSGRMEVCLTDYHLTPVFSGREMPLLLPVSLVTSLSLVLKDCPVWRAFCRFGTLPSFYRGCSELWCFFQANGSPALSHWLDVARGPPPPSVSGLKWTSESKIGSQRMAEIHQEQNCLPHHHLQLILSHLNGFML